jgi:hypothetical protein
MPDYETLQRVGKENLKHVLSNDCTDPDCEVHHPEVGVEEETVNLTDLAFWIAGFFAGVESCSGYLDGLIDNVRDELMAPGGPLSPEIVKELMGSGQEDEADTEG